jgi:hypothetical protein
MGLTEFQDFWIKPDGTQVRIMSYTCNNATNDIDFYNTVDRHYHKNLANQIYSYLNYNTATATVNHKYDAGGGYYFDWNYSNQGLQLLMPAVPISFAQANQVALPTMLNTQTYTQFTKEVLVNGGLLKGNDGIYCGGNFGHNIYPNVTPFHVGSAGTFDSTLKIADFKFNSLNPSNGLFTHNLNYDGTDIKYISYGYGGYMQFATGSINFYGAGIGNAGTVAAGSTLFVLSPTRVTMPKIADASNEFADNAAASAAGLTAGMLYRTGSIVKIVVAAP